MAELLKSFFPEIEKQLTMKDVMTRSKLTYKPVYFGLRRLVQEKFLLHERKGRLHLLKLDLKNEKVRKLLENFELEKKENYFTKNQKICAVATQILKRIDGTSNLLTVLFGSYARKKTTAISDVDIFFVIGALKDQKLIENICNTISLEYGVAISPIIVSLEEFRKMLIERNQFTQNLLKDRIILFGSEFFYNELIKSMEKLKWL